FFQAEDGIRDYKVTGVQTCALPIYFREVDLPVRGDSDRVGSDPGTCGSQRVAGRVLCHDGTDLDDGNASRAAQERQRVAHRTRRSEERRVGKEGRSGWAAERCKEK